MLDTLESFLFNQLMRNLRLCIALKRNQIQGKVDVKYQMIWTDCFYHLFQVFLESNTWAGTLLENQSRFLPFLIPKFAGYWIFHNPRN